MTMNAAERTWLKIGMPGGKRASPTVGVQREALPTAPAGRSCSLVLQEADTVAAALAHFRRKPALGFSDTLVLEIARKAGHTPLGTFDKGLGRLAGAQKL